MEQGLEGLEAFEGLDKPISQTGSNQPQPRGQLRSPETTRGTKKKVTFNRSISEDINYRRPITHQVDL